MISFFTRPYYLGNRYPNEMSGNHVLRLSSRIRGEEIANYLGAKLNPKSGYENDVVIHVKPGGLSRVRDGHWVDVLDGGPILNYIGQRPGVNLIASSQNSYEILKNLFPNKIVLIPCHHINQEREKQIGSGVSVAGYTGSPSVMSFKIYKRLEKELVGAGIRMIINYDFTSRQTAKDVYRDADVFIIAAWELPDFNPHKIPTKLINAMSYGTPVIAHPLSGYKELEGYYLPASSYAEVITQIERLRDIDFYQEVREKGLVKAEEYHISKIAELYKTL